MKRFFDTLIAKILPRAESTGSGWLHQHLELFFLRSNFLEMTEKSHFSLIV